MSYFEDYDYNYEEMAKEAEVRGVLAAFCDSGFLKVASSEDFDDLTEKVAYVLDDYYTVDDVADAADYVIKEAAEADADAKKWYKKLWDATKRSYHGKELWNDPKNKGFWRKAGVVGRVGAAYGLPVAALGGAGYGLYRAGKNSH